MKSIVSVGFIATILLMPDVVAIGYLALLGDLSAIAALGALLSIPGEIVLSLMA